MLTPDHLDEAIVAAAYVVLGQTMLACAAFTAYLVRLLRRWDRKDQ